jgi:hypothetical protein
MILPLDLMEELDDDWTNPELREFVRARLSAGDPGPLFLGDEGATTPLYDLECARLDLLDLLRLRSESGSREPGAGSPESARSP